MKKYIGVIVGALVILAFVLYYFLSGSGGQSPATVAGTPAGGIADIGTTANQNSSTPAAGTPPAPTLTSTPTPTPTPAQTGQYKDGIYTGPVTDAVYGQLQVVVTIANGKIVNTNCPIYPSDNGHSMEVSSYSLPQLRQEAIASQSANVDVVSGATQTSGAYQQSLAAALAMARN
jgi:uncharacterized protein with FMN-binding domain